MRRGGDTPGPKTLCSVEINAGKYITFYFQNDVLYANTDDGSSALWVCDGNGVLIENISYDLSNRTQILAAINGYYGTSFTGWSDNEISLRLGDTLPNWNEYELVN